VYGQNLKVLVTKEWAPFHQSGVEMGYVKLTILLAQEKLIVTGPIATPSSCSHSSLALIS